MVPKISLYIYTFDYTFVFLTRLCGCHYMYQAQQWFFFTIKMLLSASTVYFLTIIRPVPKKLDLPTPPLGKIIPFEIHHFIPP